MLLLSSPPSLSLQWPSHFQHQVKMLGNCIKYLQLLGTISILFRRMPRLPNVCDYYHDRSIVQIASVVQGFNVPWPDQVELLSNIVQPPIHPAALLSCIFHRVCMVYSAKVQPILEPFCTLQLSIVNFDVDFVSLSCLFEWSYSMSYTMTMALPLIVVGIQWLRHQFFGLEKDACVRISTTFLVCGWLRGCVVVWLRACACACVRARVRACMVA